jgi:hypothetical protein
MYKLDFSSPNMSVTASPPYGYQPVRVGGATKNLKKRKFHQKFNNLIKKHLTKDDFFLIIE